MARGCRGGGWHCLMIGFYDWLTRVSLSSEKLRQTSLFTDSYWQIHVLGSPFVIFIQIVIQKIYYN